MISSYNSHGMPSKYLEFFCAIFFCFSSFAINFSSSNFSSSVCYVGDEIKSRIRVRFVPLVLAWIYLCTGPIFLRQLLTDFWGLWMSTWYWLTSHSFIVILLIWGQSYRYLKWMAVVLGEPNIKSFCSSKIWLGTPWISAWLVSRRSSGILTLASTITWSPSKKGK